MDRSSWKKKGARTAVLLLFFAGGLSGCTQLMSARPEGPWYQAYQPINDSESQAFRESVFDEAVAEFGEPAVPIREVLLRRSRKTEEARRYRLGEDFSLTECVDPTNGLFVIYIGVDPGHSNYHALLAHECIHLLNPYITDWYMEGMATVFSEQVCEEQGKEWGDWKRHFMRSRHDPYALSYRMMVELQEAFPQAYPLIMRCTAPHDAKSGKWLRIDIDRWIDTLPPERRQEARDIIAPYTSVLRRHTSKIYGFSAPGKN